MPKLPVHIVMLDSPSAGTVTMQALQLLRSADALFCPVPRTAAERPAPFDAAALLRELGIDGARLHPYPYSAQASRGVTAAELTEVADAVATLAASQRVAVVVCDPAGLAAAHRHIGTRLAVAGFDVGYAAGVPAWMAAMAAAGVVAGDDEPLTLLPRVSRPETLQQLLRAGHAVVVQQAAAGEAAVKAVLTAWRDEASCEWHYFEPAAVPFHASDPAEILARPFAPGSLLFIRRR